MSKTDAKEAVLKYLKMQNRPYSANDITQNLHKEYGKTAIQKALDDLASKELIKEKVYGKQKVYAPVQEDAMDKVAMDAMLSQLDFQINETSSNLTRAEQELRTVEGELKDFNNQLSTEEAVKMVENLTATVVHLEERLEALTKNSHTISSEEKQKITKENDKVVKEYRKRKRICMDIANSILENYPKPKKTFFEEVGIELDDDASR